MLRKGLSRGLGKSLSSAVAADILAPSFATVRAEAARLADGGQAVDIQFNDGAHFRLNSAWLVDAVPSRIANDFHRFDTEGLDYLSAVRATGAISEDGGTSVKLSWSGAPCAEDSVPALWLRAFAPSVGRPLNDTAADAVEERTACYGEHGAPFQGCFHAAERNATPWLGSDVRVPTFDYQELLRSEDEQLRLLNAIGHPGLVFVDGVPKPDPAALGEPIERLANDLIGNIWQHPVRVPGWWAVSSHRKYDGLTDYNTELKLPMHTDHTHYEGTPSFMQYMHQPEGDSLTQMVDGMAIEEHLKRDDPEAFEILTRTRIDHATRNQLYDSKGATRASQGMTGSEFELYTSQPVIQLRPDGQLLRILHSESKRSMLDVPFHRVDAVASAYNKLWHLINHEPKFLLEVPWQSGRTIIFNNQRLVHARAKILTEHRTVAGCSNMKHQVARKYRLLRMKAVTRQLGLDERWVIRAPEHVLDYFYDQALEAAV